MSPIFVKFLKTSILGTCKEYCDVSGSGIIEAEDIGNILVSWP